MKNEKVVESEKLPPSYPEKRVILGLLQAMGANKRGASTL